MDKTFNVNMANAKEAVKVITGYTGRNTKGGIDRISATDDESSLLDKLSERAFGSLVALMDSYKPSVNGYAITITVPANFDTNGLSQITDESASYITNYVCAEWFLVARETADAEAYRNYSHNNINNINALLSRRIKPISK